MQDLEIALGNNVINILGSQTRRGISRATESHGVGGTLFTALAATYVSVIRCIK
jgi:hypothetical protein